MTAHAHMQTPTYSISIEENTCTHAKTHNTHTQVLMSHTGFDVSDNQRCKLHTGASQLQ